MPTLILSFPAKRYHSTPWGHHVNEGMVEWPPSPWRLLRALLATGYATLQWPAEGPPTLARDLIEKLAGCLPHYRLPKAVGTHSRHYMPLARFKKGREDTTLVFDTWAKVEDDLTVTWDVALTDDETELLKELAARVGYLGRSESWLNARIAGLDESPPENPVCYPEEDGTPNRVGWEQVPLLAPVSTEEYRNWREASVAEVTSGLPQPTPGKKPTAKMRKERDKATAPYPLDIIACLQAQTSWLQGHGWSQPPGSRRVLYWRPADALEIGTPQIRHRPEARPVEAMLLAIATPSGNEHALPPAARTLAQAELLHKQLVGHLGGRHNPALNGRDEHRKPLAGPHRHAHVLPLDLNADGHLDHVLVWAPMGLDAAAQNAVRAVRQTFTKGSVGPLRLALAGSGSLSDFRLLPGPIGKGMAKVLVPVEGALQWTSITPFVPPRFLKNHGRNTVEGQITAELASRKLPEPTEVRVLDPHDDEVARRQRHFVRCRRRGPLPPNDIGFTISLRFAEPIQSALLCLGYGSHFGLGLFRPVE